MAYTADTKSPDIETGGHWMAERPILAVLQQTENRSTVGLVYCMLPDHRTLKAESLGSRSRASCKQCSTEAIKTRIGFVVKPTDIVFEVDSTNSESRNYFPNPEKRFTISHIAMAISWFVAEALCSMLSH